MSKRSKSRRRAAHRPGRAGGYLLAVLVSAVLTCVLIAALVLLLRPDALDALVVAQAAATPTAPPASPDAPAAPAQAASAVIRAGQTVNVRSGPGTAFSAVAVAAPGTTVTVLGQDDSGGWYSVRLPAGVEGWIAAELLTLDGAPPADAAATPVPAETTPEPAVCAPGELRAWWEITVPAYQQMVFSLDQMAQPLTAEEYQTLFDAARAAYAAFDGAPVPACVAAQRAELLRGFDETLAAVRDIANANPDSASSRAGSARGAFTAALAALAAEQNLVPAATGCRAEFWNTGIAAEIDRVFAAVGSVDINTSSPTDMRSVIFDLQRIRRYLGKLAAPDCVRVANEALLSALDSYIAMYQAAASSDRATAANKLAAATSQFNVFRAEMRKLGL